MKVNLITLLVVFAVIAGAVWYINNRAYSKGYRAGESSVVPQIVDTILVDRELIEVDSIYFTRTQLVKVFETTTDVDTVKVPLPRSMIIQPTEHERLVFQHTRPTHAWKAFPDRNGILVEHNRVRLTLFDPNIQAWTQHYYDVPVRDWRWGIDLGYTHIIGETGQVNLLARLSRKRIQIFGGLALNPYGGKVNWRPGGASSVAWQIGLSMTLFGDR